MLGIPIAVKLAPTTNEFLQPKRAPLQLALPHGHAVPDPSPKQNCTPADGGFGPINFARRNAAAAMSIAPPPKPWPTPGRSRSSCATPAEYRNADKRVLWFV